MSTKPAEDPAVNLNGFTLDELAGFTAEQSFDSAADLNYRLFYVGRDDVHGIVKYIIERCTVSFKMNMFGYDDNEVNAMLLALAANPQIAFQLSLDKSQAGGVHEKLLVAEWPPADMGTSVCIGQSATHQISHTKGGVIDGKVWFEGSTNFSASGEGATTYEVAAVTGKEGRPVAQNNTLLVSTDRQQAARFSAELDREHAVMVAQMAATK